MIKKNEKKNEASPKPSDNAPVKVKQNQVIGKSDAFLVRGTSNKSRTVYTVGFSSEAIALSSIPFFKANGVKALALKPLKTAKGFELRYEALEQSIIRTALRLLKSSGIAIYAGDTPGYVRKASDAGIVLAKKLAKKAKEVEDLATLVVESKKVK